MPTAIKVIATPNSNGNTTNIVPSVTTMTKSPSATNATTIASSENKKRSSSSSKSNKNSQNDKKKVKASKDSKKKSSSVTTTTKKNKIPSTIKKYFTTITSSSTPTSNDKNSKKSATTTASDKKNKTTTTPSLLEEDVVTTKDTNNEKDKSSSTSTSKKKKKSPPKSLLEELSPLLNSANKKSSKSPSKTKDKKSTSQTSKKSKILNDKKKTEKKATKSSATTTKVKKKNTPKEVTSSISTKEKKSPKKVTPPSSFDGTENNNSASQENPNNLVGSAITCIENVELSKPKKQKVSSTTAKKLTYKEMILQTLVQCKDYKNGLTIDGLCKTLPLHYPKELNDTNPTSLRKSIRSSIHTSIKTNIIIQVLNKKSYKLTTDGRKMMKKLQKQKLKRVNELEKKKRKKELEKEKKKHALEVAREKKVAEQKRKLQEQKERLEKENEKKRLIQISKRKFPMDDLKLIQEDKVLKVLSPTKPRPDLPSLSNVFDLHLERDLIYDSLQIYHVLNGDIGTVFKDTDIPKFTLSEWFTCISKLSNSKVLPPLITELFHQVLKEILCKKQRPRNNAQKKLQNTFDKLSGTLENKYAWPYVCYEYMKVMDNYYKSSDLDGLWIYEKENYLVYGPPPTEYQNGYLEENMHDAHSKLLTTDLFTAPELSCNEILSLLKLLCDDLFDDDSMEDYINNIKNERATLEKNNRQCEIVHRRVKAGYEASLEQKDDDEMDTDTDKKSNKENDSSNDKSSNKKSTSKEIKDKKENEESNDDKEKEEGDNEGDITNSNEKSQAKKQQFYTREEYDETKEARDNAIDAYEKACKTLITNSTPIGQDRNFRPYYSFSSDPTLILIENKMDKNDLDLFSLITSRSQLDQLLASLDVRGIRECQLHSQLLTRRKGLYNDIKTEQEILKKKKKERELDGLVDKLKLLENESNNENIRRSSRTTELEIEKIRGQINDAKITLEEYKNQGTQSHLKSKDKTRTKNTSVNYNEMTSFFVNELIDLESLWTDDLCLIEDETFDKRKWKANLNNKSKLKNYGTCLDTLKKCLLSLEEYIHKSTNIDVFFTGYSTLDSDDTASSGHKIQHAESDATSKGDKDDDDSITTSNDVQEDSTDEHFLSEQASIILLQKCAALTLHLSDDALEGDKDKSTTQSMNNPLDILDQRSDWISLVKSCNTFSMFAIIFQSLKKDIKDLANVLKPRQEILFDLLKKSKSRKKKDKVELNPSSKLWTPARITNNFVWVQWRQPFKQMISFPARICEPINPDIAKFLEKLNATMYAPIGEDINSYCILNEDVIDFHPTKHDEKVKLNEGCDYWKQCFEIATSLYETE